MADAQPPVPPPAAAAQPALSAAAEHAKLVVECLRPELKEGAAVVESSTPQVQLEAIKLHMLRPGGPLMDRGDALRGRHEASEQLGVNSNKRKGVSHDDAVKGYVHYCYICQMFCVGKWQTHARGTHIGKMKNMLWAAISSIAEDKMFLIAAAADAPVLSSDSSDEEVGGVAAGARGKHALDGPAAADAAAGASDEPPRKRARAAAAAGGGESEARGFTSDGDRKQPAYELPAQVHPAYYQSTKDLIMYDDFYQPTIRIRGLLKVFTREELPEIHPRLDRTQLNELFAKLHACKQVQDDPAYIMHKEPKVFGRKAKLYYYDDKWQWEPSSTQKLYRDG